MKVLHYPVWLAGIRARTWVNTVSSVFLLPSSQDYHMGPPYTRLSNLALTLVAHIGPSRKSNQLDGTPPDRRQRRLRYDLLPGTALCLPEHHALR